LDNSSSCCGSGMVVGEGIRCEEMSHEPLQFNVDKLQVVCFMADVGQEGTNHASLYDKIAFLLTSGSQRISRLLRPRQRRLELLLSTLRI
jgi:hypothetical protein